MCPRSGHEPVRSLIHDSWYRSATGGINAQGIEAPLNSDRDEIEYLTRANAELLSAARRSFASLGQLLDGTGAMLVLADSDGVLIDAIGDKKTLHDGMDIHLAIGGKWNEDAVGTNGIGTALWTGEPISSMRPNISAPASNPGPAPARRSAIRWTARSSASSTCRAIRRSSGRTTPRSSPPQPGRSKRRLAEQQQEQRTRLLEAFISSAPSYRRKDGLVIVDHRGRAIFCNNVPDGETTEMMDGPMEPGRGRWLMNLPSSGSDADLAKALPAHLRSCHITPLKLDGDLRGAALVFPSGAGSLQRDGGDRRQQAASESRRDDRRRKRRVLAAVESPPRRRFERRHFAADRGRDRCGKRAVCAAGPCRHRRTANDPFIAMNCGAITKELFGSELFGHVAGAFTGASREGKPGIFELANGGVLSLDEIGELPLEIQPFLLRVLEERVVHRIGDSRGRPVDVRLVASTNRDLKQEVAAGRFRRDLYYRIGAVSITCPAAARARRRRAAAGRAFQPADRRPGRQGAAGIFKRSAGPLLAYRWPGNVRELKNLVERLHVVVRGRESDCRTFPGKSVRPAEFESDVGAQRPSHWMLGGLRGRGGTPGNEEALGSGRRRSQRDRAAARHSRPTLYRKLDQYGIRRGFL